MAADWPNSIASFTTKSPGDTIEEAHINRLQEEVVAVETFLGLNPEGGNSTVSDRLDSMSTDLVEIKSGAGGGGANLILNGGFMISQELGYTDTTTSFYTITGNKYVVDGFRADSNQNTYFRFSTALATDATGTASGCYDHRVLTFTGMTNSFAVTDYLYLRTFIEDQQLAGLIQESTSTVDKHLTLRFEVAATNSGTYCVSFQHNNYSYINEYSISSSFGVWTTITVTFPMAMSFWSVSAAFPGTCNSANTTAVTGPGLVITWAIMGGSAIADTAGSWRQTTSAHTTSQEPSLNTSDIFKIRRIKLDVGQNATPWIPPDFATELMRAQRYYQKSYNIEDAVGTTTSADDGSARQNIGGGAMTDFGIQLATTMRTIPTIITWGTGDNTADRVRSNAGIQTNYFNYIGQNGFGVGNNGTVDGVLEFNWSADARF